MKENVFLVIPYIKNWNYAFFIHFSFPPLEAEEHNSVYIGKSKMEVTNLRKIV